MSNAEVIQSMTVAELSRFIDSVIDMDILEKCLCCDDDDFGKRCRSCFSEWLRQDSQTGDGLLAAEQQLKWRVH